MCELSKVEQDYGAGCRGDANDNGLFAKLFNSKDYTKLDLS